RLKHAAMPLQAHPTDARVTCLTLQQVQQLACSHGRTLQPHLRLQSGLECSQAFPTLFPCFSRISLSPMRYSSVWNEKQERLHTGTLLHGKYQALAEMAHSYSACVWCRAHMDTLPSKKKG